jgi:HPt (histidine-containing phosphotransfer) domain-containing protein
VDILEKAIAKRNPAPKPVASVVVLDTKELLRTLDNDAAVLKSILEQVINDTPECLLKIENLIQAGDAAAIRVEIHRLKGMCLNIGAEEMAQIAARALKIDKSEPAETYGVTVKLLIEAYYRLEKEIKKRK